MGKTRDLLNKIRDTKGTFHAKMGSIKDINGRLLFIILSRFVIAFLPKSVF